MQTKVRQQEQKLKNLEAELSQKVRYLCSILFW